MVRNKVKALAIVGVIFMLSFGLGQSALSAKSDTIPELETLIRENESNKNLALAVTGTVDGAKDGYILVYVTPTNDEFAEMGDGAEFSTPLASATRVSPNGKFQLRLDPQSPLLETGLNNLDLSYTTKDGDVRIAMTSIEVEQNGKSSNRRFTKTRDVVFEVPERPTSGAIDEAEDDGLGTGRGQAVDEPEAGEYDSYACTNTILANYASGWENYYVNPGDLIVKDTVLVSGTNTMWATVSAKHTSGSSSTLGYGYKANGGGWIDGSGTRSVTVSSQASKTWPASNAYGTFSYQMDVGLQYRQRVCYNASGIPYSNVQYMEPVLFTGGNYSPNKWTNSLYPTHCVPQSPGTYTLQNSQAMKWTNGFKIGAAPWISFNTETRSGFNSSTSVTFEFSASKWLCGAQDVPGGVPRTVIADWKNR